jgi:hypothetical protein
MIIKEMFCQYQNNLIFRKRRNYKVQKIKMTLERVIYFRLLIDAVIGATSLIIKVNTGFIYHYYGHSGYKLKTTDLKESTNIKS